MKVVFLDIDGVLNTGYWLTHQYNINKKRFACTDFYFQPTCVKQLKRIIEVTDAKIVISSVWRNNDKRIAVIETNFVIHGLNPLRIIGTTPYLIENNKEMQRGCEIFHWIEKYNNNAQNLDKISNFVIIDDETDMGDLMPFLVKCNFTLGLTKKLADKAIRILNGLK